jgi:hypothetical protein
MNRVRRSTPIARDGAEMEVLVKQAEIISGRDLCSFSILMFINNLPG